VNDISLITRKLRKALRTAVGRNRADALLLGGLDSSILAVFAPLKAFTVKLESYGEDDNYAQVVAQSLGMPHEVLVVSIDETFEIIPEVISILRTYDLHLPNHVAALAALKLAKEKGLKTLMTGDGGDELFAGYSYMLKMDDLDVYIRQLAKRMHFVAGELAHYLGMELSQPYLDQDFVKLALDIKPELKVVTEKGVTWGKWILRKAFENALPSDIIWQHKRPFERGSGFSELREMIKSRIPDAEFERKRKRYPVKFYNKEHLFYYEIYNRIFGEIPPPRLGEKACQGCGGGLPIGATYCRRCGWTQDKEVKW